MSRSDAFASTSADSGNGGSYICGSYISCVEFAFRVVAPVTLGATGERILP